MAKTHMSPPLDHACGVPATGGGEEGSHSGTWLTHRAHTHQPAAYAAPRAEDQESVLVRGEGVLHDVALLQQAETVGDASIGTSAGGRSAAARTSPEPAQAGVWGEAGPLFWALKHPRWRRPPLKPQTHQDGGGGTRPPSCSQALSSHQHGDIHSLTVCSQAGRTRAQCWPHSTHQKGDPWGSNDTPGCGSAVELAKRKKPCSLPLVQGE